MTAERSSNLITEDEFAAAVKGAGYRTPTTAQYKGMCAALPVGSISTRRDLAQFLAQILWESDGLECKEEYLAVSDPAATAAAYASSGDNGKTFHGRGYIQLTWSSNYRAASQGIFGDDRLYRTPEVVASDEYIAWAVSFWYWHTSVASAPNYGRGFGVTTKAINGVLECAGGDSTKAKKRYEIYTKVAAALGETPLGPEGCYS
ncbi:chitinase [Nocardia sp. NPDC050175]|uniref:chitinase n=1 Tax=Nocardia sp. NPDC050175 TaxID=3364317 RepID=UPI0037B73BC4